MAKIVPYGDLNAHGSLANSLSFRRRFNYVVLQKKPFPKQPNSAGQIAQRTAFKNASLSWYGYDFFSKTYFNKRGPQIGLTGQNLFIQAQLKNIMPVQNPMAITEISEAQLGQIYGDLVAGASFYLVSNSGGANFGNIADPQNVFSQDTIFPSNEDLYIEVEAQGMDYTLTFRDWIYIKTKNYSAVEKEFIIRFPEITIPDGTTDQFYISLDGSSFSDNLYAHLFATNNF